MSEDNQYDHGGEGQQAVLSSTAMESIKSILNTPADVDQLSVTPSKVKCSWLNSISHEDDDNTIEIVEEIPLPDRPIKTSWRQSRFKADIDGDEALKETIKSSVSADAKKLGTKPKLTNISLLSTSVAHSTLERCLLGCNKGELPHQGSTISSDEGEIVINYSKQCKPGHVIDLLELRRLSSRGIPDQPPELRARASSAPATNINPSPDNSEHGIHSSTSAGNIQSSSGNPHRSYRPLVWRVLLGYLPPETDLWNEVLTRDRKLYANFVNEMFSSTCPAPHEVYDEDSLKRRHVQEEEHLKTQQFLKGQKVIRTDEVKEGQVKTNGDAPETPKPDSDSNHSHHVTPGLLSARMQQEWVRGDDSIFQTPDGRRLSEEEGNNTLSRISPLCAMNTPRTRSRKPLSVGATISEEKSDVLNSKSSCGNDGAPSVGLIKSVTQSNSNEGDEITGMMNTLLLPDDMDESEVRKDMTRSVSITTTESGKDEAVELCRKDSSDCTTEKSPIVLSPSQDLDEEENILLLDEIRKDVIRTHPDLRFFLEPNEDLGQKRYAALERILYVWASLNKGVSTILMPLVRIAHDA